MGKIDRYVGKGINEGRLNEYKSANWGGVKVQLVTQGALQPAQMSNFAKILGITNDMQQVSLPGVYNLLMRAFRTDQKKRGEIKRVFIKSFGSNSIEGEQGRNPYEHLSEEEIDKAVGTDGDNVSDKIAHGIDHIVRSASLIKSATATGIYDTESVINSLNVLGSDINRVIGQLTGGPDDGQPSEHPSDEPAPANGQESKRNEAEVIKNTQAMSTFFQVGKKHGMQSMVENNYGVLYFNKQYKDYPKIYMQGQAHDFGIYCEFGGAFGPTGLRHLREWVKMLSTVEKVLLDLNREFPGSTDF